MPKFMSLPALMSGSTSSIAPITTAATDLLEWSVTAMTTLWSWMIANPLITALCGMIILSFAAGFFFRFIRNL